jgi:hypothetical protein
MTLRSAFLQSLPVLQAYLKDNTAEVDSVIQRAYAANSWFIPEFSKLALHAIVEEFLDEHKVSKWISTYLASGKHQKIAIIMAGNLPLVGFHDLLCVLASGHQAMVKCSDKDSVLLPWLASQWIRIAPELNSSIQFVERFEGFDAVIATGSNNSSRYFEYYFRSHPHILRRNRNGIAVLTGEESVEDLKNLSNDIFQYFGMGCRNVSKIFVPQGYDFTPWKETISGWAYLGDHNKYRNNLDYNFAIYIINSITHIQLGQLIIKEDESISSRIGCLHFSYYSDALALQDILDQKREEIQCVVSGSPVPGWEHVGFGQSQQPRLDQYADGVDTMAFLAAL